MAVHENPVLLTLKDAEGNKHLLYPVTTLDCVDGAENLLRLDQAEELMLQNLQKHYPVGSIYMSVLQTDPATLFGFGTWERIQDRFLLAAGSQYSAGETGGEAEHSLTIEEMPSHNHKNTYPATSTTVGAGEATGYMWNTAGDDWGIQSDTETGGGKAHNNMPPYLAVYMWKRTQ